MHSQFEGVKVAMKQDKTGYVLTLSMHPDEVPELCYDEVPQNGRLYEMLHMRGRCHTKVSQKKHVLQASKIYANAISCKK
jgi:hypothetical protein